jgi:nitrite reductase (NO-forming) / hydroxylamine reductase
MFMLNRHVVSAFVIGSLAVLSACGGGEPPEAGGASAESGRTAAVENPGQAIFQKSCFACHSIGEGARVGPDLKDVNKRREREWLVRWISDPIGMAQTDPIGQQIFAEFNKTPMAPNFLSPEEIGQVLDYIAGVSDGTLAAASTETDVPEELTAAQFEQGKEIFFNRCAGCHGTLRAGATGPDIQPDVTTQRGSAVLKATLSHGLPGGMPAWGDAGILSEEEINIMARYVQMDPPTPPARPMSEIRDSWNMIVPVNDRPTSPVTKRNWENFFGVVLRDAGQVAIIDGDTKEKLAIINTGFAVHILRASSSGRYFYVVGRDGKVSLIDLWTELPTLVAEAQGCADARSVDGSKFGGFEDRYLIEGCYWPTQYVVFDGLTLEPLAVHDVGGAAYDTGEKLSEVRVASIVASHFDPVWVLGLKESGHVGIVDYSKPDFPMTARIPAERFLHDGGWDHTGRYFMIAANQRNKMAVVDVQEQKLVTTFETGNVPHPGRGANWQDPEYGWVNATTHIGQGLLAVYGADPVGRPDIAWTVVRRVEFQGSGSLFLKTHPNSKWVWLDMPLNNTPETTRQTCVYSKAKGEIEKCWTIGPRGAAVHFEYNKAGTEVWVSLWDKKGELVIYDDATLTEKTRITGDWLVTPTGKFNVYNTANDIY